MQTEVKVYCYYLADKTADGRTMSRRLLEKLLGVTSFSQLVIGDHGKPYLKDGPYFSISDEDGLTVMAVSDKEIGADLHQIGIADEAVVRRYFTAEEYKAFIDASEEEKPLIFGKLWSRTESSLKCIGTGLDLDFRNHRDMIDHLCVKYTLLPGGYILACACEEDFTMHIINLTDNDLELSAYNYFNSDGGSGKMDPKTDGEINMAKDYMILTLSPGSTSTKVAIFKGEERIFKSNVTHDPAELKQFDYAGDQLEYRIDAIMKELPAST